MNQFLKADYKNISTISIENKGYSVRELTKFFDKEKWTKRFVNGYSGEMQPLMVIYSDISKFFVISKDGVEMGYARISNYSHIFNEVYTDEVWSISEIFVLEKYRNNGVMRQLITSLVADHEVKSIYLTKERFQEHKKCLGELGFGECLVLGDSAFYMVYLNKFRSVIDNLCLYKNYARFSSKSTVLH